MWSVNNHTPFAEHHGFVRDHRGTSFWQVWIKASFLIRPGRPCLFTRAQRPVNTAPLFEGDDPEGRLLADGEAVPAKPRVDVTARARAYPPDPRSPLPFEASIRIGSWRKAIEVHPPGSYTARGRAEWARDRPNTPVELAWQEAYGGAAKDDEGVLHAFQANPAGRGFVPRGGDPAGRPLPRLAFPGDPPDRAGHAVAPAALAPVPRHWEPRRKLGGTYDEAWETTRAPLLPEDLDPAYWQEAPPDQQLERGQVEGEVIELRFILPPAANPTMAPAECRVPRLGLEMATRFRGAWRQSEMALQALALDTEAEEGPILSLTYMGALPLGAAQHDVHVDLSRIDLRSHEGFRARPEDAPLFTTPASTLPASALEEA